MGSSQWKNGVSNCGPSQVSLATGPNSCNSLLCRCVEQLRVYHWLSPFACQSADGETLRGVNLG
jgi:hypothetical protein